MLTFIGSTAAVLGCVSIIGAIANAILKRKEAARAEELIAVGWLILAVLCLR